MLRGRTRPLFTVSVNVRMDYYLESSNNSEICLSVSVSYPTRELKLQDVICKISLIEPGTRSWRGRIHQIVLGCSRPEHMGTPDWQRGHCNMSLLAWISIAIFSSEFRGSEDEQLCSPLDGWCLAHSLSHRLLTVCSGTRSPSSL